MRIIYQFCKKLIILAATFSILITIVLNGAYFIINRYYQNNPLFSRLASVAFHQSVKIKNVHIDGFSFFPTLVFHDVQLSSAIGDNTSFRQISVRLNLWDSVLQRHLVTEEIMLDGLILPIQNNIQHTAAKNLLGLTAWIALQPDITLQNTKIIFCRDRKNCLTFFPVNIVIQNRGQQHKLVASAKWQSALFNIHANMVGNVLENPYSTAHIFISGEHIIIPNGSVNFTAQTQYDHGQWQAVSILANATFFGETIKNIVATISNFKNPVLSGAAKMTMPFQKAFLLAQKFPQFHSKSFKNITGSGLISCESQFQFPLKNIFVKNFSLITKNKITLRNNAIQFREWHFALSKVAGNIHFKNNMMTADNMTAILLNQPVTFSVTATRDEKINLSLQQFIFLHQVWRNIVIHISPEGFHATADNAMAGNLNITATRVPDGFSFSTLKLQSPLLLFSAHGDWLWNHSQQKTNLSGIMQSDNLGKILSQFQLSSQLVGGIFASEFALTWPNSPQNFLMSDANGRVRIDLQKGRIIHLNSETSSNIFLANLFNLFSLDSISNFLTLDFSHFTEKGFPFDVMMGTADVRNGFLTTKNTIIESPIAKINLFGKISLQNEANDLLLSITPNNVTGSVPTIAGLAGGPVAGAVTWVANKLVSSHVDDMMHAQYRITGTLQKPVVKVVG